MNQEIAIIRGMLAELRQKKLSLEARIAASVRAAKSLLAGFELRPIREVDIAGAAIHLRDAEALAEELSAVVRDIAAAERELA
jgi:hypothetical protein